jgi:hypothetical protein
MKLNKMKKFTYYTIIGKDTNLFLGHIKNIKEYAGFDKLPCDKEFIVIIYMNSKIPKEITKNLINICINNDIRFVLYDEFHSTFIENLYHCWNLGYEHSDDGYVFRGGSDQFFSKDSFLAMYNSLEKIENKRCILQANTIENIKRSPESRHLLMDFGDTFDNFKLNDFEEYCKKINNGIEEDLINIEQSLKYWNRPKKIYCSLGNIDRVDGCSWLMTKQEWQKYGPLKTIENGITGDVLIHDVMQRDGYEELIVKDCITYHFVRGESLEQY